MALSFFGTRERNLKNASLALAAADDDELACSLLTANTAAFARTGERPYSCQVDGCGYFNERLHDCTVDGRGYSASSSVAIEEHTRAHDE